MTPTEWYKFRKDCDRRTGNVDTGRCRCFWDKAEPKPVPLCSADQLLCPGLRHKDARFGGLWMRGE